MCAVHPHASLHGCVQAAAEGIQMVVGLPLPGVPNLVHIRVVQEELRSVGCRKNRLQKRTGDERC